MTLAEVRAHDPYGGRGPEGGKRYLCPFPDSNCIAHQNPRKDRTLSLHERTGVYNCKRCGTKGLLDDFKTDRPRSSSREIARAQLGRFFGLRHRDQVKLSVVREEPRLADIAKRLKLITGTPGAAYLESRGVPVPDADAGLTRFAASWLGEGPAVVFPSRDASGHVVALHGRFLAWNGQGLKSRSFGPISRGVFATPGVLDAPLVAIVEAPLDALSLAACGLPAVALFGCGAAAQYTFLRKRFAFRTVVIATDNDAAGEKANIDLCETLRLGTRCLRFPFPAGVKDANEWLLSDPAAFTAACAKFEDSLAAGVAPDHKADDLLNYAASLGL